MINNKHTGASVPDQALAVPAEPVTRLGPSGFDPSRNDLRLLNYLAGFGCNLSQCSLEEGGARMVEGPAADSAGEVGLQAFANYMRMPVKVVTGSHYHNGKTFEPASAIEAPSGVETGNTDSTEGESAVGEAETPKPSRKEGP